MARSHRNVALVTLAAALVLAACGGDDDTADPAGDPAGGTTSSTSAPADESTTAPSTTEAPTTTATSTTEAASSGSETATESTTEAPTTEPPVTEPPVTEPAAPTDDCLVGAWVVDEAEMNAFYDAIESQIDQPIEFTISGEAGLEFTETTFEWTPAFELELSLSGVEGSGVAGGTISGTYTTADSVLTTEVTDSAMSMTIDVAGQTIDGSELGNGFITSVPFVDSPYTCDGPTPVIMFETLAERHPVTLAPAG